MKDQDAPFLILWDIDRTLVDIGSVSHEIYARAFAWVTGQPLRELAEMAGRTDRAIIIDTLVLHGIPEPQAKLNEFYAALAVAADELRDRIRTVGRRLAGTREAIARLARDGVVQSVVTGNIKPIAVIKLETFSLANHIDFDVGGYGSDDGARAVLVRLARERAEHKHGIAFPGKHVVVIGDTPHDMLAAHKAGVHAIGVATGSNTVTDLAAAKADVVIPDLTDTETFAQAVFGHTLGE
jgi:phosphoglycolate phosphatase